MTNKNCIKNSAQNKKGLAYEHYVARLMSQSGYRVSLTKASGDFGADILATDMFGRRVCVQCKAYRAGVKAVQEVIGAMAYYRCQIGIVAAAGFTKSAKELANRSGVLLWRVT